MGKAKPLSASVRPAQSFQHGGILSTALLLPLIFLPTVFVGLEEGSKQRPVPPTEVGYLVFAGAGVLLLSQHRTFCSVFKPG
jgi:hypothetical protein